MSPQQLGGTRLKAAASFAETGDTRDIATRIWESPVGERQGLITKVFHFSLLAKLILTSQGNRFVDKSHK